MRPADFSDDSLQISKIVDSEMNVMKGSGIKTARVTTEHQLWMLSRGERKRNVWQLYSKYLQVYFTARFVGGEDFSVNCEGKRSERFVLQSKRCLLGCLWGGDELPSPQYSGPVKCQYAHTNVRALSPKNSLERKAKEKTHHSDSHFYACSLRVGGGAGGGQVKRLVDHEDRLTC